MYKCLIIDDENEFLKSEIYKALDKFPVNFIIYKKQNLKEIFQTNKPDFIIIDISYKDGNGFTYLTMIDTYNIPVIVYTSIDDINAKINCYKLGVYDFLNKNSFEPELYYKIKNLLKTIQTNKTLSSYNLKLERLVDEKINTLNNTNNVIIYTLANLVESRESSGGTHLENISFFSKILTENLLTIGKYKNKISDDFLKNIPLAAALHDIGKIGIKDTVLLKPAKLTFDEFEYIKLHTVIGGKVLEDCKNKISSSYLIDLAIDIAYYHHERWDGTGYNIGLKKDEIPLSARIVALADVYDAMTSRRIYKKQFPHKFALDYILEQKGKHFDPVIVKAFINCEEIFINHKKGQFNNAN